MKLKWRKDITQAISALVVVVMAFSLLGCSEDTENASTQENDELISQDEEEWIEISDIDDLRDIECDRDGKYILTTDIDLSEYAFGNWDPLCSSSQPFTGTLDGNGYCIRNLNVDISYSSSIKDSEYAGLFCCVEGATFKNLGIVGGNVTIRSANVSTSCCAGVFAGKSSSKRIGTESVDGWSKGVYTLTEVTNCYVINVNVSSEKIGEEDSNLRMSIGGFFGKGSANFTDCYSNAKLSAAKIYDDQVMGGFIGESTSYGEDNPTTITSCYCLGRLDGGAIEGDYPGAFVGYSFFDTYVDINNSYYGTDEDYKTLKVAVTDRKDEEFNNVVSLSLEQMKQESSYVGYDFENTWEISSDKNGGYPYLKSQRTVDFSVNNQSAETVTTEASMGANKDSLTPADLRKAILGKWNKNSTLYIFYEDGSCRMLFDDGSLGSYEITEDKALNIDMDWTSKKLEWDSDSLYSNQGWYYTSNDELIIEGVLLDRVEALSQSGNGSKTDLSEFLGKDIDNFVQKVGNMQRQGSGPEIEYTNGVLTVSADWDTNEISFVSVDGACDYSILGIEYGMNFNEAVQIAYCSYSEVSINESDYKRFIMKDGTTLSICGDGNNVTQISLSKIH